MMDSKPNILIIGGGAIGLCAAHFLSRDGATVTVLDKGEMGHGSSLHNAGFISPSHFVPLATPGLIRQAVRWMVNPRSPFYIKPRLNGELLRWMFRFWRSCDEKVVRRVMPFLLDLLSDSSRLTIYLAGEEGMNFSLSRRGLCMLHTTPRGKHTCEKEAHLASELGVEARLLDSQGLHALDKAVEFRANGGLFFPGDSHLVPADFVQNLAAALSRRGVTLIRDCRVTGFDITDRRVSGVRTDKGLYQADDIVLAGGAWMPELVRPLGIRMLMQAGKGYSITIHDPPTKPSLSYILTERRVAVTPFPTALRFAGTMEIAGVDLSIHQLRVEAILDAVPQYFGNIPRPDSSMHEIWAGLRPVTPDGIPYIGRMAQYSNLITATGHAMLGMSLAMVTGKLVSEIAGGRKTSHDLTLMDPNRFD